MRLEGELHLNKNPVSFPESGIGIKTKNAHYHPPSPSLHPDQRDELSNYFFFLLS